MGVSVTWEEAVTGDDEDGEHYCDDVGSCIDDCDYCYSFHCVYGTCEEYDDDED